MPRKIISNRDVKEILKRTVELIEGAFYEYGVPHVEPVFSEEHVTRLPYNTPFQYQDILKYDIVYPGNVKLNEKVMLSAVSIVLNATDIKNVMCRITATTINKIDEYNNYLCRWRGMCTLTDGEAPDFKLMIDDMLDDSVYEEGNKLPHLLTICKILDNGFIQQKLFTPPLDN
jgi:hypothetical protein